MQQSGSDIQQEARLAALAPTLDSMRGEVDSLRESLRRTLADCSKRCEEAESACARRASNVQETAMSAAKELWEEHLGVVAEYFRVQGQDHEPAAASAATAESR
eukprot:885475-Amphidinium_carterae.1